MKILLFSDSHHNISDMVNVVNACKEDTSLIVHLGDMVSDARTLMERFRDIPIIMLKGNNDYFEPDIDSESLYSFEGIRCLFTHGHRYGVKFDMKGITLRAQDVNADVVVFGHTHTPYLSKEGGIIYLNPGSIGQIRNGYSTFAIVQIEAGSVLSADLLTFNPVSKEIDFLKR